MAEIGTFIAEKYWGHEIKRTRGERFASKWWITTHQTAQNYRDEGDFSRFKSKIIFGLPLLFAISAEKDDVSCWMD